MANSKIHRAQQQFFQFSAPLNQAIQLLLANEVRSCKITVKYAGLFNIATLIIAAQNEIHAQDCHA